MKKIKLFSILILLVLLLVACGGSSEATEEPTEEPNTGLPDEMLDTIWEWTEIKVTDPDAWSSPIVDPPNYTVFFNSDGFSDVEADCNFIQGEYEVAGENLIQCWRSNLLRLRPRICLLHVFDPDGTGGQLQTGRR